MANKWHIRDVKIPPIYKSKTLEDYRTPKLSKFFKGNFIDYDLKDLLDDFKKGKSLVFTGLTGTGKTHLAVALIKMCHTSGLLDKAPLFLAAEDFFLEIKAGYESSVTEKEILDRLTWNPLLLFDDMGVSTANDWSRVRLYGLFDRRYRYMKQTIVTANISLDAIARNYDDRIASRFCEMGVIVKFEGEDMRLSL